VWGEAFLYKWEQFLQPLALLSTAALKYNHALLMPKF
jgi:hypothetical protein